jgi:transcriptional regulator with XRE-family HTH domain
MHPTITFGAFLAVCREVSGKTQAQIAEACAITPEAVCQLERGRRKPGFELILKLADALQVDRALLSRFALQSRAPEFYTTLGLAPVEQEALDAAYPHPEPAGLLALLSEEPRSAAAPSLEGPLPLSSAVSSESTPQAG